MTDLKNVYVVLCCLMLISCKSFEERHYDSLETNASRLNVPYMGEFEFILDDGIHSFQEIRFNNNNTALLTKKAMFDKHGMWDEKLKVLDQSRLSILIWRNKKLLPEVEENFTVIASSMEDFGLMFGSFLVFDSNRTDQLKEDAPYRKELILYLTSLMKKINESDRRFYKQYHAGVNLEGPH